ncbi:hypothetical protein B5M47_00230 [candidate division CPR3 bacterium 4484_211]|uniref:Glycosyl transferase family 1 domain-containing protein n=1 Tax=candidate division CPR3 bacterium 4484_211 TaxID=1968527 RepID=A0A1W9NZF6_UNCC3|nr:MAG: hypothetical protein B5M47_00230 [candidate division CPR3 bacterium 4484_211]
MRIAVVAEICNPKSGARAPIELAKALAEKNEVLFYATDSQKDPDTQKDLENHGVKTRLLSQNKTPFIGRWITALNLTYTIKKDQPRLLSTHCMLPFFIGCKLTGLPTVMTYHGTQFNILKEKLIPNSLGSYLITPLDKLLNTIIWLKSALSILSAQKVIAISQYTQQEVKKLYRRHALFIYQGTKLLPATPDDNPQTTSCPLHQPVSTRFDAGQIQWTEQTSKPKAKFTILSVSRFTPYKGFHHLIEIFKQLSLKYGNLKLILAGSLGSKKYLNYLKKISTPDVLFYTNIPDKQLATFYQSCEAYATCDRYLFFGLPIMEAASFGKPSLALNFCAANEIIKHGKTGFIADNLEEFKNYLEQFIQKEEVRKKLGKNAKQFSQKFSWKNTAEEYLQAFKQICLK